jgi:hypothetical protein
MDSRIYRFFEYDDHFKWKVGYGSYLNQTSWKLKFAFRPKDHIYGESSAACMSSSSRYMPSAICQTWTVLSSPTLAMTHGWYLFHEKSEIFALWPPWENRSSGGPSSASPSDCSSPILKALLIGQMRQNTFWVEVAQTYQKV